MNQKICAFTSLTDSVIRGLPYNEYCIRSVIGNKYEEDEMEIAFAIRQHDWQLAKKYASKLLCDQFESKVTEDLSKFNRVMGMTVPKCRYPSPGEIYDQVLACIYSSTDSKIRRLSTEQAHKICATLAKTKEWTISFKSMIVFEVYKLWYASVTAGHPEPPVVYVNCARRPDMPEHWMHMPTTCTPCLSVKEVAYEEDKGYYDPTNPGDYYPSRAIYNLKVI